MFVVKGPDTCTCPRLLILDVALESVELFSDSQPVKHSLFIKVPFFKLAMRHWSEPLIVAQFRKTDFIFDGAMEQISIIKCHNFDMGNYQCSNYRWNNNSSFHFAANESTLLNLIYLLFYRLYILSFIILNLSWRCHLIYQFIFENWLLL